MAKSDYSFIQKSLHRVALQLPIAEASFDIDNILIKNPAENFADNHVFVSGLARSGTTILLQYLYQSGKFRSLTYQDMPFVLMPNLWKQIAHKKSPAVYKERTHEDGIMVGFDSPEAFEEVFWRIFTGRQYILNDSLLSYNVDDAVLEKFSLYVRNILISSNDKTQTRYLSKNNNNVLRLASIQKAMPRAHIIVPFRDPLQQAYSLLSQHRLFFVKQSQDKFSLSYMNWLGHFEFGLNQKPFFLGNEATFNEMNQYSKTDINYWLANWKNYYQYITHNCTGNMILFNYDDFCRQPQVILNKLFEKLNIPVAGVQLAPFILMPKNAEHVDQELLSTCHSIYDQLQDKAVY